LPVHLRAEAGGRGRYTIASCDCVGVDRGDVGGIDVDVEVDVEVDDAEVDDAPM
jgi:hypothetical protein